MYEKPESNIRIFNLSENELALRVKYIFIRD